ncbi:MAG: LysM peptidoglycan-binding domain-containing protein [Alistipes sp.]|nr:LysM peptidoglycan-binding domain-containing protein [Alistipes sp.]
MIYVARKQNEWLGNARRHKVREGETLRSVSQDYGIRLAKLAKINKMNKTQSLQAGTEIKLQK